MCPNILSGLAELDRAPGNALRHITIPMVSPITLFNLIISVIAISIFFASLCVWCSSSYDWQYHGCTLNSTLFYSVYLYQTGFRYLKIGYASAMAWILFLIILGCTILILRSSDRWTYYAG
jgi:multiple sugar transport system permease protein